ncbi:MAG TPA: TIR domain-containing protein, partial [Aggregatilineales bacterium]|nr:TIR domain-containing protein [Aggregatilineales bacterium]
MADAQPSESLIFISYSRANKEFVTRLTTDLQARGLKVWIDKQGLKAGTPNWEQALRDAIQGAQAVLLIATPDSRQSNYVSDELGIAEMYRKPVYPVWAAGEEWMESIRMGLGSTQFIDAREARYATALDEIMTALGSATTVQPTPEPPPDFVPRNPYKGLNAFTQEDRSDFFGRDMLVDALVTAVQQADKERFVAIVGPSGSGKSSVVMAGLLPRLADLHPDWITLPPLRPGTSPLTALAVVMSKAMPAKSIKALREDLDDPGGQGLDLLARSLVMRPGSRVLLLVDQFEEVFTQASDEAERRQFIDLLTTAALEAHGPLTVIVTLRADFYDRPLNYADLAALIKAHTEIVPPLSLSDLRDVIEKPAELPDVRLTFDDGLVAELVFEVRQQAGALPLLQFTLDQLFERRDGHRLTFAAYREIGGVRGALAKHAEGIYAALPSDDYRKLARALFLRLIEPGATEQDTTRRRAALSELILPDAAQTTMLQAITDAFIGGRLLTTDKIAGVTTIEVSHEALIREWERLGNWLKDARDDVRLQKQISQDAAEWLRRGQRADDDGLYRGTVLIDAQDWARRSVPSATEAAFIEASATAESARRRHDEAVARRVRNFQRATVGLALVFVLALVGTVIIVMFLLSAVNTATARQNEAAQRVDAANATLTPIPMTLN